MAGRVYNPAIRRRFQSTAAGATAAARKTSTIENEPWRKNLIGLDEARLQGPRDKQWWYTGTAPQDAPGFDGLHLRSLAQPRLDAVTKQSAIAYFQNTWALYELLFSSLKGEEAFFRPPQHGLRHPMQFYYGHTAVLYINKALVAGLLNKPIEPSFEAQFEVGVDEMRWDDMTLGDRKWPRVSEVLEYRKQVYRTIMEVLDKNLDSSPKKIDWNHPMWSFFMGCEHDRIHLETSSVLIRELPLSLVQKPEGWVESFRSQTNNNVYPKNELISIKGQDVHLGKSKDYPTYGWDNEYGTRIVKVQDFSASKDLVTNGEFLEFVKAGGYRDRRFWSEDGWGWRRFRNAQHPFFWVRNGPAGSHQYLIRHMFEVTDFTLSLPVVVNYHEAKAFCEWKAEKENLPGLRLITEAEHQLTLNKNRRMEFVTADTDPAVIASGKTLDEDYGTNSSLAYSSERPVDARPANDVGFRDSMGNVWQWCEDQMYPFPGFETHPYYGDFTEPCLNGEHQMIKGGSFISSGDDGANAHSRFQFRPHFLQHSGFRYVLPTVKESRAGESGGAVVIKSKGDDVSTPAVVAAKKQTQSDYETSQMLSQYIALHFGSTNQQVTDMTLIPHANRPDHALNFPRRCAQLLIESFNSFNQTSPSDVTPKRALDLGCAVGGSSFHLAGLGFDQVVGIDLSQAFIRTADTMRKQGKLAFTLEDEAAAVATLLPEEMKQRTKTVFQVGDACALPVKDLGTFDAVLAANLLCRLPNPYACLNQLPALVKKGGIVMFVSPFSWMESFTKKKYWFGAIGQSEKELIAEMKSLGFELMKEEDVPLIMREHRRKYSYIVSHAAVFRNENA